jgi:transposase-like protein
MNRKAHAFSFLFLFSPLFALIYFTSCTYTVNQYPYYSRDQKSTRDRLMRTDEETKYDLDERIFNLYDSGMSVQSIAREVDAVTEYVVSVLENVQVEP